MDIRVPFGFVMVIPRAHRRRRAFDLRRVPRARERARKKARLHREEEGLITTSHHASGKLDDDAPSSSFPESSSKTVSSINLGVPRLLQPFAPSSRLQQCFDDRWWW